MPGSAWFEENSAILRGLSPPPSIVEDFPDGWCRKMVKEVENEESIELDLASQGLSTLPLSIGSLVHLRVLRVSINRLTWLPVSIESLVDLKVLHVSGNRLTALPDSLCKLRMLTDLRCSHNLLTRLPACIGELSNLVHLHAEYNALDSLPESCVDLTALRDFRLRGNDKLIASPLGCACISTKMPLTHISDVRKWFESREKSAAAREPEPNHDDTKKAESFAPEARQKPTLEPPSKSAAIDFPARVREVVREVERGDKASLWLAFKGLLSLPESVGRLRVTNLAVLDVRGNNLTTLPRSVGQLNALTQLIASSNMLVGLPSTICRLCRLEHLVVPDNEIETLPDEIGSCSALRVLDVRRNRLKTLPASIGDCVRLTSLHLYVKGNDELLASPLGQACLLRPSKTAQGDVRSFLEGQPSTSWSSMSRRFNKARSRPGKSHPGSVTRLWEAYQGPNPMPSNRWLPQHRDALAVHRLSAVDANTVLAKDWVALEWGLGTTHNNREGPHLSNALPRQSGASAGTKKGRGNDRSERQLRSAGALIMSSNCGSASSLGATATHARSYATAQTRRRQRMAVQIDDFDVGGTDRGKPLVQSKSTAVRHANRSGSDAVPISFERSLLHVSSLDLLVQQHGRSSPMDSNGDCSGEALTGAAGQQKDGSRFAAIAATRRRRSSQNQAWLQRSLE